MGFFSESAIFWSYTLFFLLGLFVEIGACQNQCKESRCGNGPAVRFPFRLKDGRPNHCGYPGFELSCRGKRTVLELPIPAKFYVESIDYMSQVIKLYDPNDCLFGEILKINGLSVSPFGFYEDQKANYTLYNCSVLVRYYLGGVIFPCLSDPGYQVIAIHSDTAIEDVPLGSCTKVYNILSVPHEIFSVD